MRAPAAPPLWRCATQWIAAPVGATQLLVSAPGDSQTSNPIDGSATLPVVGVLHFASVALTEARLRSMTVPYGFAISGFAQGLGKVRWMQVAANGDVYPNQASQGGVVLLRDTQDDGAADRQEPWHASQGIPRAHVSTGMEDFVTGWLLDTSPPPQFGRIAWLAVAKDGSLLIAKGQSSVIYRVRYTEQ